MARGSNENICAGIIVNSKDLKKLLEIFQLNFGAGEDDVQVFLEPTPALAGPMGRKGPFLRVTSPNADEVYAEVAGNSMFIADSEGELTTYPELPKGRSFPECLTPPATNKPLPVELL